MMHLALLHGAALGIVECDEGETHIFWVCALGAFEIGRV